jgi:hypothetical protein
MRSRAFSFLLLVAFISAGGQVMNVRKWRQNERDSLDQALLLYEENAFPEALPIFENILHNHPKEDFLRFSYARCALYRADKHADAYTLLWELYPKNKKVPGIQYDMDRAAHYNYIFDEAMRFVTMYANSRKTRSEGKKNAEILRRCISNAIYFYGFPSPARVHNLGAVNSEMDETRPVVNAEETLLW